jgi:hypothetical protein
MLHADRAKVEWNPGKKRWEVRILVGGEVIKRPIDKHSVDTGETTLKELACTTARDEGYEMSPEQVEVMSESRVSA